ncbi:phenylacetyl-CoA ligase-like protein [Xylona heveae TC161]|uniref:Phenylacetyl-CoA ligase-like protein n=1 Tax=Xylona heveae (strain CBS 132557 / TC161) TaxID=1328760 RepID=A0A165H417_XYLHT|nr:phenylacetyl-CoA ligase-like protein [Xylona heveae TC161]KZF22958.1 phenylacetyl-CoA ligase-like protein [Xylona heveae TC161]
MVFRSPEWVPKLPFDPPDSIPICDFVLREQYGRVPLNQSRAPYTCGLTGKEYSTAEVTQRVDFLARALARRLGWEPNRGSEWDKVIGVFSLNSIDTLSLAWAIHRLSGICSPTNAAYPRSELTYQLKASKAKALFTCVPLLPIALAAAHDVGIPQDRIYILELPEEFETGNDNQNNYETVNQLIDFGRGLPELEPLQWTKGQGANQTAFLCLSSGTSGLPKMAMISHRNVIANIMQIASFERPYRDKMSRSSNRPYYTEVALGLLPQSHIYALVIICHASTYRGDNVIVLPKFDLLQMLRSVEKYRINILYIVPPIILTLTKSEKVTKRFDLSSVRAVYTGAAPLGTGAAEDLQKQFSHWKIRQTYGMTEASPLVLCTNYTDIWLGSSGSLLPSTEARIVSDEGHDIEQYDQPGELFVRSPSVVLGYLNNDQANLETFQGGWLRTGDEAMVRVSPQGTEHLWIVDRLKELIKVKGHQVAPAELEDHLLSHPSVLDAAVIPVPDPESGEVPKAFIVKQPSAGVVVPNSVIKREILKHVANHKAQYKWLKGGVEFVEEIPKSPSGKILRRLLRDRERASRRQNSSKL